MPPSQLGAFARSDPSRASANIEWHVQPLSLDKFGDPLHKFNAITPSVANLQPTSRGHEKLEPALDRRSVQAPDHARRMVPKSRLRSSRSYCAGTFLARA